jgi:hypothetical protein
VGDVKKACGLPVVVSIISVRKTSRTPDTVLCPIVFVLQDEMLKKFQTYNQKTYKNSVMIFAITNVRYSRNSLYIYFVCKYLFWRDACRLYMYSLQRGMRPI